MIQITKLFLFLLIFYVQPSSALEPFFDEDPTTKHAPEDPELIDLDLDVLELCGDWGARVDAIDFENMLLRENNRESLQRIYAALGQRVYRKTDDLTDFVAQLRRAWFEQKGFKHVFCGEPGEGKDLGGLHYVARYWQAEDNNWAGYRRLNANTQSRPNAKCREFYLKERIAHPIYTISLEFLNPENPDNNIKCLSGYHYELNAERLFIAGTRALKQANKRADKNAKVACIYPTHLEGIKKHHNLLVIRQQAIRTFYPIADKKPYCRKNKKDYRDCYCSRL
ncbi:MAG: EndoU domain-containing protein [Acidiferrobacterales bacterium]|nr:EndoU domain-containing protein [Acidiferrobacterales bacterium]